ncbi:metal-dependent hydrolase [Moraxella oblonga]|uniref:metal-dependent hydrolase n=1 Tax=Moraxella oblonga TaxID=200413 RepID=UPI000A02D086|nr:metal-dependent hydrolase [Moraxella oblonga]
MANFQTHLNTSLVISTGLSVFGYMHDLYGIITAVFCVLIGTMGGLLPDIDLESSTPAQVGFFWASLGVATLMAVLYAMHRTGADVLVHTLLIWAVGFCVVRLGVFGLFSYLTVHRGMVHSVPYVAMCGLLVVYGSFWGLKTTAFVSWLFGVFLFFGGLVHLLLDEIYSVNVLNVSLKRSAGTAFKFYERKKPWRYFILYTLIAVLVFFAPDYHDTWRVMKALAISLFELGEKLPLPDELLERITQHLP